MALIKYGGGVASMQGKQGGSVHARNRAGAYIRNWAKPTNAPSDSQTNRRADFAAQSAGWSNLTDDERIAWNDWANGLTMLNRMGDTYVPTGRQMYMSCNNNLSIISRPTISDPPIGAVPPTVSPDMTLTITEADDVLQTWVIDNGTVDSDIKWLIFAAPYQIGGKRNLTTTFRIISISTTVNGHDFSPDWKSIFGDTFPVAGYSQAKIRSIDINTGLSSPWLIIEANATAETTSNAMVAAAGTSDANGLYTFTTISGGKPQYDRTGVSDNYQIFWADGDLVWNLNSTTTSPDTLYQSTDDTDFPWEATWFVVDGGSPAPTITEA